MTSPIQSNRPRVQPRQAAPAAPRQRPPATAQRPAQQPSWLQQSVSLFERNGAQLNQARGRAMRQFNLLRDSFRPANARPTGASRGMVDRLASRVPGGRQVARNLRLASPLIAGGTTAARLPGQTITAFRDIRQALRSGNSQDIRRAERSTRTALDGGVALAELGPRLRDTQRVANAAIARGGRAAQLVQAVRAPLTRLADTSAGRIATRVATRATESTAARVTARAAGRYVPVANVAIAAIDAREAYRALRDPNAGAGRRVTSVITALGSAAAATNIPIVSQAGAFVATVSDAVRSFFGW